MKQVAIKQTVQVTLVGMLVALGLLIQGCSKNVEVTEVHEAVIIHNGEECDLCGMLINQFPGPKGQLFERGGSDPKRFCSTRDLFAYALQPEHQHRVKQIYVHDVASAPWDKQGDAKYIDAASAYFVVGHNLNGAMGPTLASFATKDAAESFSRKHNGEVMRFDEIDLAVLTKLNDQAMDLGEPMHHAEHSAHSAHH